MSHICEFCGGAVANTDESCPHCGAPNPHYDPNPVTPISEPAQDAEMVFNRTPHTIEELKLWYTSHNLPPQEVTRFFIGVNYHEPKAFGIYQEGDRFIVYKNKDTGERAIRYEGTDEEYAVKELYLKLKERIAEQKAANGSYRGTTRSGSKSSRLPIFITVAAIVIILAALIFGSSSPSRGYYSYQGDQYYYLDDWYIYSTIDDLWYQTTVDSDFEENAKDYFESSSYDSSYGTSNFEDTSYYSDWEASHDSSDDSSSYWDSSDSWDSGGGDWSSDW